VSAIARVVGERVADEREGFMRTLLAIVMFATCVPAMAAEPADREKLESAVNRGLKYLQGSQERDGSWTHGGTKSTALTALSVMSFLSAGHVPGEGPYGATVEKGIRWVLEQQRPSGVFSTQENYQMYHHGICTLMLAEASGMTDAKLGVEMRQKLEKAVDYILKAQRTAGKGEGGWGYIAGIERDYADISIVGWQLLALRAAKNLGCDVPAEAIEKAVKYVRGCWDAKEGGFFYYPGYRPSTACAGTGILSLEICGKNLHRCDEVMKAGDYVLKKPPEWGGPRFFYSVYYCSQGTYQIGGRHWKEYRPLLHKAVLPHQDRDGAWVGTSGEDQLYGRNYGTAMTVLALTVEYRLLPIYQSGEDRTEKGR